MSPVDLLFEGWRSQMHDDGWGDFLWGVVVLLGFAVLCVVVLSGT